MRAFRIGSLFGIDLRVDWSWVFIFVLMTWNLVAVFARWHPAWSPALDATVALAASIVFFGCILLHELAHSVVAMGYGLRVRSITLFLFGGVSNIEREPPSASAEFFIAIVGPLTSIVLGVGFLAVASLVTPMSMSSPETTWSALGELGPLATLLAWLGPVNVMIGLFNLIPGFPLDGGRVLRSLVWSLTGDLRVATRAASATGQGIGWLFIASGIAMAFGARIPFFGTGLASGIWLTFIGWFLHGAAVQATTRLALDDAFAGMTVEQLMVRHGPIVTPDLPVAALVQEHLMAGDDRAVPVVREGELLGLVSIGDVRTLPAGLWATTPVRSIMCPVEALSMTSPHEPLVQAFEKLARGDVDQLPVVLNGTLVGMLRRRDITRWLELAWRPGAVGARGGSVRPGATGRRDSGAPFSCPASRGVR
jgi:Zn-dependent protease/CBS domain-containing protein